MDQEIILKVVGELYLKNIALQRQIQELLAEREQLRTLAEQLKDGRG